MQQNEKVNFLLKYPLLDCDHEQNQCTGPLVIQGRIVHIKIVANRKTYQVLEPELDPVTLNDLESKSVNSLLDFIQNFEAILRDLIHLRNPHFDTIAFGRLMKQYVQFTEFHLNLKTCNYSNDFRRISLSTLDERGQEHFLDIHTVFPTLGTVQFHCKSIEFPPQFQVEFSSPFSTLNSIYKRFQQVIFNLQPYYQEMDEFNALCHILEPENEREIRRKANFRRIYLDKNVSVLITVNPLQPKHAPDIQFSAPPSIREVLELKLEKNLEMWDCNDTICQNLLTLLELNEFPRKPTDPNDDSVVFKHVDQCAICLQSQLLPEIHCQSINCHTVYHVNCLSEWLKVSNADRHLNQFKGTCPNCKQFVKCPILPTD